MIRFLARVDSSATRRLALCAAMAATVGCFGSRPKLYEVTGKVTFEGEPLSDGEITFSPVDDGSEPVSDVISEGSFRLTMLAGQKRISIVSGDRNIPSRYNQTSELEKEVTPAGPNEFEFELTEKPRDP